MVTTVRAPACKLLHCARAHYCACVVLRPHTSGSRVGATIMADRVESRIESGRRSSRTRRRRKLFHLLVQKARRRLKIHRRRSARDPASSLLEIQAEEQRRIESFEKWCTKVGLELHPKVNYEIHHPHLYVTSLV